MKIKPVNARMKKKLTHADIPRSQPQDDQTTETESMFRRRRTNWKMRIDRLFTGNATGVPGDGNGRFR
jgi:hypothetical protein